MAETARFVLIDGEMLIKEQQLSQRAHLPLSIERGLVHLPQRVGFNPIDFGRDPCYLVLEFRRHLPSETWHSGPRGRHFTGRWSSSGKNQDGNCEKPYQRRR